MASDLVVPVARITNLREHPKASLLGLANILGYQVVVGLVEDPKGLIWRQFVKGKLDEKGKRIPVSEGTPGVGHFTEDRDGNKTSVPEGDIEDIMFSFQHKEGELIVYVPADTVLTDEWAEMFSVKPLLRSGNRVGKIALRGEPSFGLVVKLPDGVDWKEGDNVAEYFGCKKYEPPVRATAGDAAPRDSDIDPYFDKFTDIQNLRLFVDVFKPGEEVVVTEKLEGTNCRLGYINGHQVAGSMEVRRKRPTKLVGEADDRKDVDLDVDDPEFKRNTYWFPWSVPGVDSLLAAVDDPARASLRNNIADALLDEGKPKTRRVVELFGEVYGSSIQKGFKYDAGGGLGFRAFGLKINDKFLDWELFEFICREFGVPMVPVLYDGPFDIKAVLDLAEGPTTIGEAPLREGIVVYPKEERIDPRVGRAVLKGHGYGYSLLKGRSDSRDV